MTDKLRNRYDLKPQAARCLSVEIEITADGGMTRPGPKGALTTGQIGGRRTARRLPVAFW